MRKRFRGAIDQRQTLYLLASGKTCRKNAQLVLPDNLKTCCRPVADATKQTRRGCDKARRIPKSVIAKRCSASTAARRAPTQSRGQSLYHVANFLEQCSDVTFMNSIACATAPPDPLKLRCVRTARKQIRKKFLDDRLLARSTQFKGTRNPIIFILRLFVTPLPEALRQTLEFFRNVHDVNPLISLFR